jgi:hypothetical protein
VKIVCQHCGASYEIDPPAAPFAQERDLMFRCTACGRTLALRLNESGDLGPRPEPAPEAEEVASLLLRQEGKVYHVKDMAMLQRWIAERRLLRNDELSSGDGEWNPVGELEELQIFFDLVDASEGTEKAVGSTDQTGVALFAAPRTAGQPGNEVVLSSARSTDEIPMDPIEEEESRTLTVSPLPPGRLGPDDPTMDMSLDDEDFFSEEHTVLDPMEEGSDSLGMSSTHDDDDLDWVVDRRRNMAMWWILFFVGLGGGGYFALDFLNQADSSSAMSAPKAPATQEMPEKTVEAEVVEAADTGATEELVAEAAPEEPEPEEAPASPPPPDKPKVTATSAIDAGWNAVDHERWSTARKHFNTALQMSAGNGDARFGLAYVTENEGRIDDAVRQYCVLARTGKGEVRSEANGRVGALRASCN